MATAALNPIITSISGRMGGVVFYSRHGRQCVRSHVIPRNPDTEAQKACRRTFAGAVKSWQSMAQDEKYIFIRKARYLQMSGYNLYISQYMTKRASAVSNPGVKKISRFRIYPNGNKRIFPSVSASNISRNTESDRSAVQHDSPG
ncbi:MAG: hypothetical protein JXN64_12320 [Spirochaetes bacterium]|nr:hypothetical protein [Spirochaetota bacterium]